MAPGNHIKLIECPRDAMQGWAHPISTEKKAAYINALLKVGFHTIDFGSFVSPKGNGVGIFNKLGSILRIF